MEIRHIIPCGGLTHPGAVVKGMKVIPLTLWSGKRGGDNVTLKVEDLHKSLYRPVPAQFEDLMEIAAYVYAADQATSRGGNGVDNFGGRWRRKFEFHIPVRAFDFWSKPETGKILRETLEFLSDDYFDFNFVRAVNPPPMQKYFEDFNASWGVADIERVVMFSGGLDSLSGAVKEAVEDKRRVMLVTHRPTTKLNNVQKAIERMLAERAGKYRPMHLHVRAWKNSELSKNYTQRTRSFLFAAVGATVSRMLGLDSLRFYENGVISMNLPVCAQVVGSKATRTTHPRVLADFRRLLTAVADNPFGVENDFIWDTKADVVRRIVKEGCAELIGASISCAHVHEFELDHPHCGVCSQCIDRRLGVVAAGAERHDPEAKYKWDVFTGERPKMEDRMMVASYVERANKIAKLRDVTDLITNYPEVVRVFGYLPGKPDQVADLVLKLQKQHAAEVNGAIEKMLAIKAKELRERTLTRDCLLRLTYDSGGGAATPVAATPAAPVVSESKERQEKRWEEEKEGKNIFRLWRGYKWWNLVYAGERDVLPDDRAVNLVEYLLKHPADNPVHAVELENLVDGVPLLDGWGAIGQAEENGNVPVAVGSVGGTVQEASGRKLAGINTLPALRERYIELRATIDDETLSHEEREEARGKLSEMANANSRGGKFVDEASRAADRVRKQIKALIKELMEAEKGRGIANEVLRAFGKHLEDHLWLPSVGFKNRIGATCKPGCYTYDPPDDVRWRD